MIGYCQFCGEKAKLVKHHLSYYPQTIVVFICGKCHIRYHRDEKFRNSIHKEIEEKSILCRQSPVKPLDLRVLQTPFFRTIADLVNYIEEEAERRKQEKTY